MEAEYVIFLGSKSGLSVLDIALLSLCPVCGALGILVSDALKRVTKEPKFVPVDRLPSHYSGRSATDLSEEEKLLQYNDELRSDFYMFLRRYRQRRTINLAFIGLVLGLVISLYFVGAITSSVTALARVLALSILLGYQAPNIWSAQEKIVRKIVEDKLEKMLGQKGGGAPSPAGRVDD
jgi:hypothetical protein